MIDDRLYFKFFFSFGQVGWWTGEVLGHVQLFLDI